MDAVMRRRLQYWWMSGSEIARELLLLVLKLVLLVVLTAMALAEPIVGVVLSVLAFGGFWVTVLFGFILKMPFPHRWQMLATSIACMLLYGAYLGLMRLLARGLR